MFAEPIKMFLRHYLLSAASFVYRLLLAIGRFFRRQGSIEYFTLALVLSTAAQAYFFVQSERSFLSLSSLSVSGLITMSDQLPVVAFEIRNGGRATAFIDYVNVTFNIGPEDLPEIPPYDYAGHSAVRGPVTSGSVYYGTFRPRYALTDDLISAIKIGTIKLYIFGYIRYHDDYSVFGDKETGYCYVFNPAGDPSRFMFNDCGRERYIYAK